MSKQYTQEQFLKKITNNKEKNIKLLKKQYFSYSEYALTRKMFEYITRYPKQEDKIVYLIEAF